MKTQYDSFTSWFCFVTGLVGTVGLLFRAIYAIAIDPPYVKLLLSHHNHPSGDEILMSVLLLLSACIGALITWATGKDILRHSSEHQLKVVK